MGLHQGYGPWTQRIDFLVVSQRPSVVIGIEVEGLHETWRIEAAAPPVEPLFYISGGKCRSVTNTHGCHHLRGMEDRRRPIAPLVCIITDLSSL